MHTIYVVAGGLLLLGVFVLFARALSVRRAASGRLILMFIPIWLACAAFNMWIGVSRAGYSAADEAPIFLLVFAIPAALAWWLWRRHVRG